jgi:hypothetical protein
MTTDTAKDQLDRWLDPRPITFMGVHDWDMQPHHRPLPAAVEEIAEALRGCDDVLPDGHAHKLALPIGSTWAQAGYALQMRAGQRAMYGEAA